MAAGLMVGGLPLIEVAARRRFLVPGVPLEEISRLVGTPVLP
ncbi:hypothetical protein AB0M19_02050 [Streptomyces sp. NPDC051920]